ncbi:MAG TPA: hypothetical protein VGO96_18335 [Pyrinomonadaceae bacterium]|jgi:hypothetical protein|nr:hypothetical protein [Pyrinomonadaceae bacterium]
MTTQARIKSAFLISPLVTPFVLMLMAWQQGTFQFRDAPAYIIVHGFFAYAAVMLFGYPVFTLYRQMRWTNPLLFMLFGGLIGFLASIMFGQTLDIDSPFLFRLNDSMWFICAGALPALIFRLLLPGDWLSSALANKLP